MTPPHDGHRPGADHRPHSFASTLRLQPETSNRFLEMAHYNSRNSGPELPGQPRPAAAVHRPQPGRRTESLAPSRHAGQQGQAPGPVSGMHQNPGRGTSDKRCPTRPVLHTRRVWLIGWPLPGDTRPARQHRTRPTAERDVEQNDSRMLSAPDRQLRAHRLLTDGDRTGHGVWAGHFRGSGCSSAC